MYNNKERDKMKKTIALLQKQHDVLVQAIQTIDDHFYAIKQPKEILKLRDALDKILNHSENFYEIKAIQEDADLLNSELKKELKELKELG